MAYECLLHVNCGKTCSSTYVISKNKWESLKQKSQNWLGLDKFGDVYNSTPWENGPAGFYVHPTCYINISSSEHLERARKRKEKESDTLPSSSPKPMSEDNPETHPSPKRLRSSIGGPIHDKTKCVWCMKGADSRHPNRIRSNLFTINTKLAWQAFKRHPVLIQDKELRDRLTRLVESTSASHGSFTPIETR